MQNALSLWWPMHFIAKLHFFGQPLLEDVNKFLQLSIFILGFIQPFDNFLKLLQGYILLSLLLQCVSEELYLFEHFFLKSEKLIIVIQDLFIFLLQALVKFFIILGVFFLSHTFFSAFGLFPRQLICSYFRICFLILGFFELIYVVIDLVLKLPLINLFGFLKTIFLLKLLFFVIYLISVYNITVGPSIRRSN